MFVFITSMHARLVTMRINIATNASLRHGTATVGAAAGGGDGSLSSFFAILASRRDD